MQVYFDDFATDGWNGDKGGTWDRVQREFATDFPEPDKVYYAKYTAEGYEGDAQIVYRNGDKYYFVSGGHCSCYGLEGQFEPEEYTKETISAALDRAWNIGDDARHLILDRIKADANPTP